jgi:hypothetical protein
MYINLEVIEASPVGKWFVRSLYPAYSSSDNVIVDHFTNQYA